MKGSRVPPIYADIASAVAEHGLNLRGGFVPVPSDGVPDFAPGQPAAMALMIGNTGRAMWEAFATRAHVDAHPLDRWSQTVLDGIAARFGARAVYPYDAPPLPFQRWAARAWPLSSSPIGLLIDAEYGLWHALRGAFLLAEPIAVPAHAAVASPCDACAGKPCLSACPIGAFSAAGFDYIGCRAYLATPPGDTCLAGGCLARGACPVGRQHRYDEAQLQFHMRSFSGLTRSKR